MSYARALLIVAALAAPLGPLGRAAADEAASDAITTSKGAGAPPSAVAPAEPAKVNDRPAMPAPDSRPERRIHGEVGVAVGTGGYRSGYVTMSGPIGERGWGSLAVSETRSNRGGYYGGYPGAYADGPYGFGGSMPVGPRDCVEVERDDGLGDPAVQAACPRATRP